MASSKTFLLLPHRIPASEELLALTTISPLSPLTSNIVPTEPLSTYLPSLISPSATLVTVDAPGSQTLDVSNAISFSLNLEPVLSLATSHGKRAKYTISSKEIKKTRLRAPGNIFGKLLEKDGFKEELMKLVPRKDYVQGKRAYFIIGVVTAVDATIQHAKEQDDDSGTNVSVPLNLMTGTPLPLDAGLGGGVEYKSGTSSVTTSQAVGNDIWGVEYMEIKRGWWDPDAVRLGRQIEKVKGGRFFGHKPAEECEDEEDDTWELMGVISSLVEADDLAAFVVEVK